MTWELQRHMAEYIEPSVYYAAKECALDSRETFRGVLENWFVGQRLDEGCEDFTIEEQREQLLEAIEGMNDYNVIQMIAQFAEDEVQATTNGAHEVYLYKVGCNSVSVPWCSEDQMIGYHQGYVE